MEHRQHVEDLVGAPEIDAGGGLGGVRQHVAVGEHDALRHALRARGEQDRGRIVGPARHERLPEGGKPAQLVGKPDLGAHILEIDEPHLVGRACASERLELRLLDEGARRDDGRDLGRLARGEDVAGPGREVDHRRDAPGRHRGEERRRGAVGVRQHDAERLALGGERHELAAEHRGADEEALVGECAGDRVLDRDPPHAVRSRRLAPRPETRCGRSRWCGTRGRT